VWHGPENMNTRRSNGRAEERLRETEAEYRALVEQIPTVVYIEDLDSLTTTLYDSPQIEKVLGYPPDTYKKDPTYWTKILHPDDRARVLEEERRAAVEDGAFSLEYRVMARDGRVVWVHDEAVIVHDEEGRPRFWRGVLFDVTDRKRVEEELRENRAKFRTVFERAAIGMALVDMDGRIEESNPALQEMLGYGGEELRGKTLAEISHPEDAAVDAELYAELVAGGRDYYQVEKRYVGRDGGPVWGHLAVSVVRDGEDTPRFAVGMVENVTERKALEERLEHQAFHDDLTGLPNRTLFMDRLKQALARLERRGGTIAVLFMDLDHFKVVNDSLGHEVGDRLLKEVAGRLEECVRPEDTVARFGGDEFTVLLEGISDVSGAVRVAERISEVLRASVDLERLLFTSASIGITLGTSPLDLPGDLLRDADLAMYEAKEKGPARYEVYDPLMSRRSARRLKLEGDLRRAFELDEFKVFYQPKMLLKTGGVVGTEALVRWEHPERGLVPPSEFIPVVEEVGLIVPLGYRVLKRACRQARAWRERFSGAPGTMYVNLSARQFDDPGLVDEITKVLWETGVEPHSLAFEIPESVLMNDADSAATRLRALKALDVNVVVDNFGTAYSSLSRLGRFPMKFLNIDRSLIFRLGAEPQDTAIVSAMINLAHALGWEVTVEGVETAEQLARLRELGCDMAQGYHLWEPLTCEEMPAVLAVRRTEPLRRRASPIKGAPGTLADVRSTPLADPTVRARPPGGPAPGDRARSSPPPTRAARTGPRPSTPAWAAPRAPGR
jgi:diguanylate cyclase (GGDEF)-like protein/PAS domain S-box-containing protein